MNDIFGSGGLVYAASFEDYNFKLDCLTQKWDRQEFSESPEAPYFGDTRQMKYGTTLPPKHHEMRALGMKLKQTISRSLQTRLLNVGKSSEPLTWPVSSTFERACYQTAP